jgi:glutaredoxin
MRPGWLAIILSLSTAVADAQYKWVDSSGHVGYGDKPPAGAHDIESLQGVARGAPYDQQADLPYQLQHTVKGFPVTLYTMSGCPGCDQGRAMLKARAVPFSERTVSNAEDAQALRKLTGSDQLPAFQVGSQLITGFNSSAWESALDLAGYPHENQLPPTWTWPAPKPLVEAKPAPAAQTETAAPPGAGNAP